MRFYVLAGIIGFIILFSVILHAFTEKTNHREDCEKLGGVFITAPYAPHMCFAKESVIKVYK